MRLVLLKKQALSVLRNLLNTFFLLALQPILGLYFAAH